MVRNKPHFRMRRDGSLEHIAGPAPKVSVNSLKPSAYLGQQGYAPTQYSIWDGEKFPGGFGPTQIQTADYWTMRRRSSQLFNDNLYARGLIRRLVTNEINTGLTPDLDPDAALIGMSEEELGEWSETAERRFGIWGKQAHVCDWKQESTFGELQRVARTEALIGGDVLVVLRMSQRTRLPQVQLIKGEDVQTPLGGSSKLRRGHEIKHGVEFDAMGRQAAYWINQRDGESKRIPARGEKSGRRMAWLVYGTDKRLDDVRGQPLLSLVLQSMKEIDRYRDSAQRKAVVNSTIAMFIKKDDNKLGTLPISGGAVRRSEAQVTDGDGTKRNFDIADNLPGMVLEELQTGETPVGFHSQGTDEKFGEFEEAIIQAIAWANQIPPEILRLAFSNNYSASQAAINEFKIYLNMFWTQWGEAFCSPIMVEWIVNETLLQNIQAPGLLEAWRDSTKYDVFGAWTSMDWYGSIKPSTDVVKQAKGSEILVDRGWSTNSREARINTGTKWDRNVKRLARENRQYIEAIRPLAEFKKEFGMDPQDVDPNSAGNAAVLRAVGDLADQIEAQEA